MSTPKFTTNVSTIKFQFFGKARKKWSKGLSCFVDMTWPSLSFASPSTHLREGLSRGLLDSLDHALVALAFSTWLYPSVRSNFRRVMALIMVSWLRLPRRPVVTLIIFSTTQRGRGATMTYYNNIKQFWLGWATQILILIERERGREEKRSNGLLEPEVILV